MNLVIDLGNTLIKIAVFQENTLLVKKVFLKSEFLKNLEELALKYTEIKDVLLSSVIKVPVKGLHFLQENYTVRVLDREMPQLFKNRYASPNTLGHDRIALVSAAAKEYPTKNVLIIDSGTCITYDFKSADNEYLGGAISPGIQMRYKAMHTFTQNLPLLEPEGEVQLIATTTKNCIHSGVVNGITAEIEGIISQYKDRFPDLTIILTGGDAQFLCKRLKNSIFANSNFLLKGLNYILEFNKSQ
ncbi:MAG: type III pantothenate kinase [Gillisia sp.]